MEIIGFRMLELSLVPQLADLINQILLDLDDYEVRVKIISLALFKKLPAGESAKAWDRVIAGVRSSQQSQKLIRTAQLPEIFSEMYSQPGGLDQIMTDLAVFDSLFRNCLFQDSITVSDSQKAKICPGSCLYCLPIIDLVKGLIDGVNPLTNRPFSSSQLEFLRDRFAPEIRLLS